MTTRSSRLLLVVALVFVVGIALYRTDMHTMEPLAEPLPNEPEPTEELPPQPSPSNEQIPESPVRTPPVYKSVITTQFWVGEQSDESNGYIPNHESYWDDQWLEHFGGVDDPACRNGYHPCAFTPLENPFYVALPYGEYDEAGTGLKASAQRIPWFSSDGTEPLLKNQWVEVRYKSNVCYGQWQDVGPFLTDDFMYVFGTQAPSNTFGVKAGLDVSPALWDCLGLATNDVTTWRFVRASEVPDGPWKEIITTRGVSWK
jgi:hypothetical protein